MKFSTLYPIVVFLILSGCAGTIQLEKVDSVTLCMGGSCQPVDNHTDLTALRGALYRLLKSGQGGAYKSCSSSPTRRECSSQGLTHYVQGGPIPGFGTLTGMEIEEVGYDPSVQAIVAVVDPDMYFIGTPLLTSKHKTVLSVEGPDRITLIDQNSITNWMAVGTQVFSFNFAVDYINLDRGMLGGWYGWGVTGIGTGGGNGYALLNFPQSGSKQWFAAVPDDAPMLSIPVAADQIDPLAVQAKSIAATGSGTTADDAADHAIKLEKEQERIALAESMLAQEAERAEKKQLEIDAQFDIEASRKLKEREQKEAAERAAKAEQERLAEENRKKEELLRKQQEQQELARLQREKEIKEEEQRLARARQQAEAQKKQEEQKKIALEQKRQEEIARKRREQEIAETQKRRELERQAKLAQEIADQRKKEELLRKEEEEKLSQDRQLLEKERQRLEEVRRTAEKRRKELETLRKELEEQKQLALKLQKERLAAERERLRLEQKKREEEERLKALRMNIDFGDYYALVIGNNNYTKIPKLNTAVNDSQEIAELLENEYKFKVTLLLNATRGQILRSLNTFRKKLTQKDNLLIYYAGHGWLDNAADEGYWLPVDADTEDPVNWIANSSITASLTASNAKHVMVVADSCYSGKLMRGIKIREKTTDVIAKLAKKRTRVVLSSGGLEPVTDEGSGNHSIFAAAFINVLKENKGIIDGTQLFDLVRQPVMANADQTPEYADIHKAGHQGGDFIFVRR